MKAAYPFYGNLHTGATNIDIGSKRFAIRTGLYFGTSQQASSFADFRTNCEELANEVKLAVPEEGKVRLPRI